MPKKKIALVEIQYLPPVSYMMLFKNFDEVRIESCENYQKGSFRNRCIIATSAGTQILSVPLKKGKNDRQNIQDVQIANETAWQRSTWKSIKTAYGSSPFWIFYAEKIEPHFSKKYNFLFDFNLELLQTVLSLMKKDLPAEISFPEKYISKDELDKNFENEIQDYRNVFTPKNFAAFPVKKYPQVFSDRTGFIPNLSILDALFCSGGLKS